MGSCCHKWEQHLEYKFLRCSYISSKVYSFLISSPTRCLCFQKTFVNCGDTGNNEALLTRKATKCTNTSTIILLLQIGRVVLCSVLGYELLSIFSNFLELLIEITPLMLLYIFNANVWRIEKIKDQAKGWFLINVLK